jgi:hypothetical protein
MRKDPPTFPWIDYRRDLTVFISKIRPRGTIISAPEALTGESLELVFPTIPTSLMDSVFTAAESAILRALETCISVLEVAFWSSVTRSKRQTGKFVTCAAE